MATGEQSPLDRIRQRITKYRDEGKWDRVVREYEALLDFFPRDAEIRKQFADALFKAGQGLTGIKEYFTAAQIYEEGGARDKAIPMLKRILKLKPSMRELHVRIGDLYARDGRIPDATENYNNAFEYFSESGQMQDALAVQRKIVNLQPDDVVNHRRLAEAYEANAMNKEAIHEYRQLVKKMQSQGMRSDLYSLLSRIVKLQPDSYPELVELARLHLSDADTASACECVRQILSREPEYPEAFRILGAIMRKEGDPVRAVKAYQKYLVHFPKNTDILLEAAGLYCDLKQPEAALDLSLRFIDAVDIDAADNRGHITTLIRRIHDLKPADINFQEQYVTLLTKVRDTERVTSELRYLASLYKLAGIEDKAEKTLALIETTFTSPNGRLADGASLWNNHEAKQLLTSMIDPFVPLASLGLESLVENIIVDDDVPLEGGESLLSHIPVQVKFKRDKRRNYAGHSQIKLLLARSLVQMEKYREAMVELAPLTSDKDARDLAYALMGICHKALGSSKLAEACILNINDRTVLDKLKAYDLSP